MRPYETLVVLNSGLGDEIGKLVTRFETIIRNEGGTLDASRDWGVRDLAYPIHKNAQGRYFLIEYQAEPPAVKELERNLRIIEGVLRFVSVQQEHTGLPEPRVQRDYGDRRDVPLHEMRSGGMDEPGDTAPVEDAVMAIEDDVAASGEEERGE